MRRPDSRGGCSRRWWSGAAPCARADEALPASVAEVLAGAEAFAVVSIDPKVHRPWGYGRRRTAGGLAVAGGGGGAEGVYGRVEVAEAAGGRRS
jgi:hypothetical protein